MTAHTYLLAHWPEDRGRECIVCGGPGLWRAPQGWVCSEACGDVAHILRLEVLTKAAGWHTLPLHTTSDGTE